MQLWPELLKPERAHWAAASAMSPSSQTIVAAFPPSSRTSRFPAPLRATAWPVPTLPVKLIAATWGPDVSTPATSGPPWTTCTASSAMPASSSARTSAIELAGACGGGLTIVVFAAAYDAPSLCARRLTGALNGVIATTTPTGARNVIAVVPTPRSHPGVGSTSPPKRRHSAAQMAKVSAARTTSPRPSFMGLPSSSASSRAISSTRLLSRPAARSRTSAREAGDRRLDAGRVPARVRERVGGVAIIGLRRPADRAAHVRSDPLLPARRSPISGHQSPGRPRPRRTLTMASSLGILSV